MGFFSGIHLIPGEGGQVTLDISLYGKVDPSTAAKVRAQMPSILEKVGADEKYKDYHLVPGEVEAPTTGSGKQSSWRGVPWPVIGWRLPSLSGVVYA